MEIIPEFKGTRISKRKRQFDELCDDYDFVNADHKFKVIVFL